MIRRLAALAVLALLAACGPKAPEPPPPTGPGNWTLQASATSGAAIVHTTGTGAADLRIACRRNPTDLYAAAPGFKPIASEERFSIGSGNVVVSLVADPKADPAEGVTASGPMADELIRAWEAGGPVGVSYGAQTLTLPGLDPALAKSFAAACAVGPTPAPAPSPTAATIPARFQGEWNAKPEACGTSDSDSRLRITADQLLFWESSGPVTSVEVVSQDEIIVHAAISGEGAGPTDSTYRYRLLDGGETLRHVGFDDFDRKRCPTN